MRKIAFILISLCLSVAAATAQTADFKKAVGKYKAAKTVTAQVKKTVSKAALAKSEVTRGTLTMKAPSEVSIVMEGGKDQLLMKGSAFTMVARGKRHATDSRENPQFATFQTVFESILSGGEKSISGLSDLKITRQGQQLVLTITPQAADKKSRRRMMFTSLVLTIDTQTSQLSSLTMKERSGNTTVYTFSAFDFKK